MAVTPSKNEQEYFIKQEMERLRKLREEHLSELKASEREEMRKQHYMRCAKCGQHMETTRMESVEIEICPDCGGVYLDAGELAKILDEKHRDPFTRAITLARRFWLGGE